MTLVCPRARLRPRIVVQVQKPLASRWTFKFESEPNFILALVMPLHWLKSGRGVGPDKGLLTNMKFELARQLTVRVVSLRADSEGRPPTQVVRLRFEDAEVSNNCPFGCGPILQSMAAEAGRVTSKKVPRARRVVSSR